MRIAIVLVILFLSYTAAKAYLAAEDEQRRAVMEEAQKIVDSITPDMTPPLSEKPIDPAAIAAVGKISDKTNEFCAEMGRALRTQNNTEYKRAIIHRASEEFGSHLKFDQQDSIKNRSIQIGMTPCMALAAWGPPKSINSSVSSYSTNEQWVYQSEYLYFENHVLSSFQTNR